MSLLISHSIITAFICLGYGSGSQRIRLHSGVPRGVVLKHCGHQAIDTALAPEELFWLGGLFFTTKHISYGAPSLPKFSTFGAAFDPGPAIPAPHTDSEQLPDSELSTGAMAKVEGKAGVEAGIKTRMELPISSPSPSTQSTMDDIDTENESGSQLFYGPLNPHQVSLSEPSPIGDKTGTSNGLSDPIDNPGIDYSRTSLSRMPRYTTFPSGLSRDWLPSGIAS